MSEAPPLSGLGIHAIAVCKPFATSTSPVTKTGGGLDGREVSAGELISVWSPSGIVVGASTATAAYSLSAITVSDDHGHSEALTPTSIDGGWLLRTTGTFEGALSIAIPAQATTAGQLWIGTWRSIPFTAQE